jgi:hypothetical protein
MGIVFVCVLIALLLFGAAMLNPGESVDVNTPQIQSPGTGENKTP